jgi:hypothetical protein
MGSGSWKSSPANGRGAPVGALGAGLRRVLAAVAAVSLAAAPGARAESAFLGVPIQPVEQTYVVLQDVHVRAEPSTKGSRVGTIKGNERVWVAGKTSGGWLAVARDGKNWGFIYTPQVMPLLDGSLDRELAGRVQVDDRTACEFRVRFEGRNEIEGEEFQSFDYEAAYACTIDGKKVEFAAPMFLTEAPYQLSQNAVYQIGVDLLELYHGASEVLSTVLLYDRDKDKVSLESVSVEEFRSPNPLREKAAGGVKEALAAAAEMALRAWNRKLFLQLRDATR